MASLKDLILSLSPEQQQYIARLVASMPESEGGLGLPLKNTAAQRAKMGGYDTPMYHLTSEDFPEFDLSRSSKTAGFGPGIYAAKEPRALEGWAKRQEGMNVMPLLAKTQNVLPLQNLSQEQASKLSQYFGREVSPEAGIPYFSLENRGGSVAEGAEQAGFSGVEHVGPGSTGEHVVFRDPSALRSKFAAFNPWMKDEANLLASHPLASAGAALAATGGLSGMAREYFNQPHDPFDQYAQYGLQPPLKKGDVASTALGAVPGGLGDIMTLVDLLKRFGK